MSGRSFLQRYTQRLKGEAKYQSIPSSSSDRGPNNQDARKVILSDHPVPVTRLGWPWSLFWSLLPWFLAAPLGKSERRLSKVSSTSYLNGMRGIACFFVYNYHIIGHYYYPILRNAFGTSPSDQNHYFVQLPIIRVFYAGKAMVCLFFVLSGFVLTCSPLRKIASASSGDELLTSLCSSVIRRGPRLFGPMLVLAAMLCVIAFVFPAQVPPEWRPGDATFFQHVWLYVRITIPFMNPFIRTGLAPSYISQCWTIPYEFRGSMVVFLLCLVGSRLTTRARKLMLCVVTFGSLYYGIWETFCFVSGMFLAELRFCPLAADFPSCRREVPQIIKSFLASLLLLTSLVFCSWPDAGSEAEPFKSLFAITPVMWSDADQSSRYWGSLGGFAMVAATESLQSVQWLLSTRPFLYLGEISFSVYLLHWFMFGWANIVIYTPLVAHGWPELTSVYVQYFWTTAILLVASDLYWRAVDEKCTLLSRKLVVDWLGVGEKADAPLSLPIQEDRRIEGNVDMNIQEEADMVDKTE